MLNNAALILNGLFTTTAATAANDSTTTIEVNGTRCHPILFNLGGLSMEANPTFEYGICPDTIFAVLFPSLTLFVSLLFSLLGSIGIYLKRKSGHLTARNPVLMASTLAASLLFVFISTIRYLV